jgi:hypothetical protein
MCFEKSGVRFFWVRGLCYLEIGGAEKKISRGDMMGSGCGGRGPQYVVTTM